MTRLAFWLMPMWRRTAVVVVSLACACVAVMPQSVQASFDRDYIMSDAVFENAGTMSANDINNFLNRYPNSCISPNRGFSAPSLTGYSPQTGFTYGGNVSAGEIIYKAASVYGLNPQVILATLQKEQSLVTGGSGCDTWGYVAAMGNDCPDSGGTYSYSGFVLYSLNGNNVTSTGSTCVNRANSAGFSRQIITATWKLKFWQERSRGNVNWAVMLPGWDNSDDPPTCYSQKMTEGWRKRCINGDSNYYDGLYSIDGTTVRMGSGATAALYTYTPHFHGNQNFVNLFENTFGFGSVHSGMLNIVHPDGTLVRPANSPQVYLLKDGKAQYATSASVFRSWGFDFGRVKIATQADLNLLAATDADTDHSDTPAPLQYREGTLIKGASSPIIYVIQNVDGANTKRSLGTYNNFVQLGYTAADVSFVPDGEVPAQTGAAYDDGQEVHPDGTLVRSANSPTVYIILGGARHSMTSPAVMASHGLEFSKVKIATSGDEQLPVTWPVSWYGEGALLRGGGGPTVYIVDNDESGIRSSKRSFGTYYNFVGLDYRFSEVLVVPDGELPSSNGPQINQ